MIDTAVIKHVLAEAPTGAWMTEAAIVRNAEDMGLVPFGWEPSDAALDAIARDPGMERRADEDQDAFRVRPWWWAG
jgi:hypothetical protein